MAKKIPAPKKPHPLQSVREDVEVQVGIFALPNPAGGEEGGAAAGEPEEALVWMVVDGPLLGDEVGSHADLLAQAGPLLRESLKNLPFLPGTVRAATGELVAALRPQLSSRVKLVEGPTPELAEVAAEMMEDGEIPSYLGAGADEKRVASFFAAAARLYRAAPWKAISADHLIGVTIEDLVMHDEVLAVIGPSRASKPGWILANDAQELDDYGEAMERDEAGEEVTFPPIQMVVFEPRGDLLPELVEEITSHRWEVAGPKACPYVATMGADGLFEAPEEQDYAIGEAVSQALADLVGQTLPLRRALAGETPPLVFETEVDLHGDKLKVVMTAPFLDADAPVQRPDHPILAALYDLEGDEEIDSDQRSALDRQLLAEFKASAAGEKHPSPRWLPKILEIAGNGLGITAASLVAGALEDVLFEIFPTLTPAGPGDAEAVIAECHAFFQFLAADCGQEHAYACVELLDADDIVEELKTALAEKPRFGGPQALPDAAPPAPEKKNGPSPADRNKTKTAGPPTGSSRRRR